MVNALKKLKGLIKSSKPYQNIKIKIGNQKSDNIKLDTINDRKNEICNAINISKKIIFALLGLVVVISFILKLILLLNFFEASQILDYVQKIPKLSVFTNYISWIDGISLKENLSSDIIAVIALIISIYTFRFSKNYDIVSQYSNFEIDKIKICRFADFDTISEMPENSNSCSLIRNDIKNNFPWSQKHLQNAYIFELRAKKRLNNVYGYKYKRF